MTSEVNAVQEGNTCLCFQVRILSLVIIPIVKVTVTPIKDIAIAKLVNVLIIYP
jgi:hypothetical protein